MPRFDIIVIGAGLVGLTASIGLARKGHSITVLESSSDLQIVGDSIALAANAQRVLQRYGILEDFQRTAAKHLGEMQHQ